MMTNPDPILSVRGLTTAFGAGRHEMLAVRDVSFDLAPGRIVALVGESGSGKTVTAFSIVRLIRPPGRIVAGQVIFGGADLLPLDQERMRRLRGDRIGMVLQNPMTALNPSMPVGSQIVEVIRTHRDLSRAAAWQRAIELLAAVHIAAPERTAHMYPYELSGGMRQRAVIAQAVALEPDLLIADEPTTALDVTVQAQIVALLSDLRQKANTTILFITHDLSLASGFCDEVVVMYGGQVVEAGPAEGIFSYPRHPYTAALIEAIPSTFWGEGRVVSIPGQAASVTHARQLTHCQFANRCPRVMARCRHESPALLDVGSGRSVRCLLYDSRDPSEPAAGSNESGGRQ